MHQITVPNNIKQKKNWENTKESTSMPSTTVSLQADYVTCGDKEIHVLLFSITYLSILKIQQNLQIITINFVVL